MELTVYTKVNIPTLKAVNKKKHIAFVEAQ